MSSSGLSDFVAEEMRCTRRGLRPSEKGPLRALSLVVFYLEYWSRWTSCLCSCPAITISFGRFGLGVAAPHRLVYLLYNTLKFMVFNYYLYRCTQRLLKFQISRRRHMSSTPFVAAAAYLPIPLGVNWGTERAFERTCDTQSVFRHYWNTNQGVPLIQ